MRNLLYFFILIALKLSTHAQSVKSLNCIDEGRFELLKLKENLDDNNYLLYYKSFIPDSAYAISPYYWLHKVNSNGNTVWKQQIPNSHKGYYTIYLPNWVGYITFKANDFPNKLYTMLNDELIFHYAYYDSVSIDSAGINLGNDILTFAVMNHSDGSYRSSFINIDTLISNPLDTSIQIYKCLVNKINDSIYQMAVHYSKGVYWFLNNIYGYSFTNFYTINIISHQVVKQSYRDYFNSVSSIQNRFYTLRNEYVNFDENKLYLSRINLEGKTDTTVQFIQTTYGGSFIEHQQGASVLLLCNVKLDENKQNSVLVRVDTTTFHVDYSYFKDNIDHTEINNGYERISFVDYPQFDNAAEYNFLGSNRYKYLDLSSFKKTGNKRFVTHSYGYIDSTYTNYSKIFLSRLNLENGMIEAETEIQNTIGRYADQLFRDDILPENEILLPQDSVTGIIYSADTIFQSIIFEKHLLSLSKLDSNLQTIWTTSFPESVTLDSLVYESGITQFNGSINFTYYPVNYHNQFIVGLSYERLSDSVSYFPTSIIRYFLINKANGEIKEMNLPFFLSQRYLTFFNSPSNVLSIITNDSCSVNNLDIGIYTYNEIINSVKPIKINSDLDFKIYPNPANATVQIDFSNELKEKDAILQIVDISGKIVQQYKINTTNSISIATDKLSIGLYFLQINIRNESVTKKFQVIH